MKICSHGLTCVSEALSQSFWYASGIEVLGADLPVFFDPVDVNYQR